MAYKDNEKRKNPAASDPHTGRGGRGVKKYPADRNFGGEDRRGGSPSRERDGRRPAEARSTYDRKPRKEGRPDSRPEGRPEGGAARKPHGSWDKPYDKHPPRDTYTPTETARVQDTEEDEEDTPYDPTEGLVIGRNAVRELLRSERTVDKLLVHRGEREGSIVMLVAEAVNRGIPVVEVDRAKLDEMAGFVPHQGVIAMVAQKEYVTVEDILALAAEHGEKPLIVIADGITDPYNLGALIRCAEGVGAHGLIIPRRRAVGLTALVAKASAGAMEHLAVAKVANIAATIKVLKEKGVWCFAAEAGGRPHYETDLTGPCALVFGSEGNGVSRVVKQACDGVISIPMYGQVNSFNVSTAAAVILCEAARQMRRQPKD